MLGLPALDLPRSCDNHRKGPEVGDVGQDAHAATDGGIKAGGLGENVATCEESGAAAMEKVSGPEKVRVHGHDCTMSRTDSGKDDIEAMSSDFEATPKQEIFD